MTEHTYNLATRLRAIACDSRHTVQPGRRALTVEDLPEEIFVTARFATHPWGISGQLWARNSAAVLLRIRGRHRPRRGARLDHLAYPAFPVREPAVDLHRRRDRRGSMAIMQPAENEAEEDDRPAEKGCDDPAV